MENIKSFFQTVAGIVAIILIADFIGFCAWIYSGQHPVDNFYLGTITAHILKAIIF